MMHITVKMKSAMKCVVQVKGKKSINFRRLLLANHCAVAKMHPFRMFFDSSIDGQCLQLYLQLFPNCQILGAKHPTKSGKTSRLPLMSKGSGEMFNSGQNKALIKSFPW